METDYHSVENKEAVDNYHRGRQVFIIDNGEIVLSEADTTYSHKDFLLLGLEKTEEEAQEIMNHTLRGYLDESGNIYLYRGYDFDFEESDVVKAKEIVQKLSTKIELDKEGSVFGGVVAAEPGTKWPPKMVLGKISDFINSKKS